MNKFKKFMLCFMTCLSGFITGCNEKVKSIENQAAGKIVEVADELNHKLNLNQDSAIMRGVNFDEQSSIKTLHIIAENKEESKPYFIKCSFTSKTNNLHETLKFILNNKDSSIYNIEVQETTYDILKMIEKADSLQANPLNKIEDGNNFYKYHINSVFYELNEDKSVNIVINSSVTNMYTEQIPTLIGDAWVLMDQNHYYNYANSSLINIETQYLNVNEQIKQILKDVINNNSDLTITNIYYCDNFNYNSETIKNLINKTNEEISLE